MKPPTFSPWRPGKCGGSVVTDIPSGDALRGSDSTGYYGGHLIAESVAPSHIPLIAAAPRLLRALELMVAWHGRRGDVTGPDEILPPEYQTCEVREAMAAIRAATTPINSTEKA